MNLEQMQNKLTSCFAERKVLNNQLEIAVKRSKTLKIQRSRANRAKILIQQAAMLTQQKLEYHISNIVSLALASVFDNPYEFKAKFVTRRNSTECDLLFERNGKEMSPLDSAGGGTIDVASFGLRIAYWAIKESRPIIILDEPFRHLNDPTRGLHNKAAEMIKMISDKLGLQMLIVSQVQELADIADKVFLVSCKKEISEVKELE